MDTSDPQYMRVVLYQERRNREGISCRGVDGLAPESQRQLVLRYLSSKRGQGTSVYVGGVLLSCDLAKMYTPSLAPLTLAKIHAQREQFERFEMTAREHGVLR